MKEVQKFAKNIIEQIQYGSSESDVIQLLEDFIKDLKKTETEESLINTFIGKISHDTYNKIRRSNSDSECRRYLKNIING